jgi:hypothetical protein
VENRETAAGLRARPNRKPAAGTPAARPGSVVVEVKPAVEISLRGRRLGTSPLRIDLPAGRYPLRLTNPAEDIDETLWVRVRAAAEERYILDLSRGRVAVYVKPWGKVRVDGTPRGTTPLAPLALTAGHHVIEVVHPDSGKSATRSVDVVAGELQVVKIDLTLD